MKARIEFEVESEQEFERLKESNQLPNEEWTLFQSNASINFFKQLHIFELFLDDNTDIFDMWYEEKFKCLDENVNVKISHDEANPTKWGLSNKEYKEFSEKFMTLKKPKKRFIMCLDRDKEIHKR